MGEKKQRREVAFTNPQMEQGLQDVDVHKRMVYFNPNCLVCGRKIEVKDAPNGFIHFRSVSKETPSCEQLASTGKVIYPKPDMLPVTLDGEGIATAEA